MDPTRQEKADRQAGMTDAPEYCVLTLALMPIKGEEAADQDVVDALSYRTSQPSSEMVGSSHMCERTCENMNAALEDQILKLLRRGHYSHRSVQKITEQAIEKAGIQNKASAHTLRHSLATHLLEHGADIRYIQELLGHSTINTTQIYAHIARQQVEKIVSPLDQIMKGAKDVPR